MWLRPKKKSKPRAKVSVPLDEIDGIRKRTLNDLADALAFTAADALSLPDEELIGCYAINEENLADFKQKLKEAK